MPVERVTGQLPRWVRDPRVMDWLAEEDVAAAVERCAEQHLEWERCGGTRAPGPARVPDVQEEGRQWARLEAFYMLIAALDLHFGTDRWASAWADGPMRWDAAPGGPPASLVAAVRDRRGARPRGTEPGVPGPPDPEEEG